MNAWFRSCMVSAIGLLLGGPPVWGQVVRERDVRITGPRGRAVERDMRSVVGPGFLDRRTTIQRPGGTVQRDVLVRQRPAFVGGGGWVGGSPWVGPRRPPVFVENVFVPRPSPLVSALPFLGGLGLGLGAGALVGATASRPIAVAPAPPPMVVVNPPQPYTPAPPPATVVIDPVADAMARLQSHHGNSRRDGAITLGRLRDPRAIPALVDRLKNDKDKEVRVASATALGAIGDPSAAIYLERTTVYDKKQEVRDAAAAALSRMPRTPPPGNPPVESSEPATIAPAPVPAIEPSGNVPPPPMPDPPAPGSRDRS